MHIGLVGGPDRSEAQYRQLAERAGHSIEWHTGDLAGRGAGTLESLVERSDLVIVVTAVNRESSVGLHPLYCLRKRPHQGRRVDHGGLSVELFWILPCSESAFSRCRSSL